ncbi:hypothetical protein J1N35_018515 [Gossypium stocksii]|uniref:Uncharacterized protein n=1 Tax=Gossypium stocksii TaxID=47602 RepID=A0A9D3VQU3_9ROSI|nr:hypothetical protein J1N35_018515 [Gossypium stocksii]
MVRTRGGGRSGKSNLNGLKSEHSQHCEVGVPVEANAYTCMTKSWSPMSLSAVIEKRCY